LRFIYSLGYKCNWSSDDCYTDEDEQAMSALLQEHKIDCSDAGK